VWRANVTHDETAEAPREPIVAAFQAFHFFGSVSELHFIELDPQAEFIPIDEQSDKNL